MKILVVEERPCPALSSFVEEVCGGRFEYIGVGVRDGKLTHVVKCRGKVHFFVNPHCRMAELLSKTGLVQTPEFRRGKLYLYLYYRSGLERLVEGRRYWVLSVKNLKLTDRQLQVLTLYARGGLKLVERELGLHKSTACRTAKRALRKLLLLYNMQFNGRGRGEGLLGE